MSKSVWDSERRRGLTYTGLRIRGLSYQEAVVRLLPTTKVYITENTYLSKLDSGVFDFTTKEDWFYSCSRLADYDSGIGTQLVIFLDEDPITNEFGEVTP